MEVLKVHPGFPFYQYLGQFLPRGIVKIKINYIKDKKHSRHYREFKHEDIRSAISFSPEFGRSESKSRVESSSKLLIFLPSF